MDGKRKEYYTTVFAQVFSPCGGYLVAGSNFGTIAVFNSSQTLHADSPADSKYPIHSFQAHNSYIYSMVSTERFLISGGSSEIHGWLWKDILNSNNPKPRWTLQPPASSPFDVAETNSIVYREKDNTLVSGGGDNNVYVWDLEMGMMTGNLQGHTDYIHCVDYIKKTDQIVSAGEDGQVLFWDPRVASGSIDSLIEPNKLEEAARPEIGKWISCMATDPSEDWLVCGGAPHLSVWHLRSKTSTTVLKTPKSCPQVVAFHDDVILSGGTEPSVFHWSINGEMKTQVPCKAKAIYSLAVNKLPNKALAVGGNSPYIDICTNFNYKAFSFYFKSNSDST